MITLKTSANTKDVLDDVRNKVNRVSLPTDAKTPTITEIETNTNQAFSVFLYDEQNALSREALISRGITLQRILEKVPGVDSANLSSQGMSSASVSTSQ